MSVNRFIFALDWSLDSRYLRAAAGVGLTATWEADTGRLCANSVGQTVFFNQPSSPFAWDTVGVWRPDSDGTDVNCVSVCEQRRLIAAATDSGGILLGEYPSSGYYAPMDIVHVHSSVSVQVVLLRAC